MTTLKIGQLASSTQRFCPFAAVTKWPYRHLHGDESEKVSDKYFAHGKFRAQGWTIYYIHTLLDFHENKPLLLIPSDEVEALFRKIHETLGVHCRFPDIARHPGFRIGFEDGPRPRYLGRLTEECSLTDLEAMILDIVEEEPQVEDRSFPAFRRKMEAAILAGKNRQKSAKDKKRRDRVATKRSWCAQLRRVQCYLGIRPRGTVDKAAFHNNPNHTWEESQAAQQAYERAAGLKLPDLITTEPAPYPFDQDVVFVSVDVEAYEKDHHKVTEIGISTLDTLDLRNTPPGEGGSEWMKKIRSRHFRIAEHGYLRNTEFVSGCADRFLERFGISEWISIKEAPQVVASCFRHPFSAPGQYYPYPEDLNKVGRVSRLLPPVDSSQPKRNVVLVGHDIKADIEYLRKIGYDLSNLPNLIEAVDTADLFRVMKHEQQTRSLGAVLLELGLVGWHLHNAGNDAGYTLEALIGISLAALRTTHSPGPDPERLDLAAAEAQARLIEDIEEWEIADEEGGDGGDAVKLLSHDEMIDKQAFEQGMKKANQAEEKRGKKRVRGGTGRGGRGLGNGYVQNDFWPAKLDGVGKGEVKFHAANEQKLKEMGDPKTQDTGNTGTLMTQDADDTDHDTAGGVPLLETSMAARLAALDEIDEYFMI